MANVSYPGVVPLEAIERDAWFDMFACMPPEVTAAFGASSKRIGSAGLFAMRAVPLVQFNHAHALGLDAPLDEATLDAIIRDFAMMTAPVSAIQIPDTAAFEPVRDWLTARGCSAQGGWAKFWRAPVPSAPTKTTLDIRTIGADRAADFGHVVQVGFSAPPPIATWTAAIVGRPGWTSYVGYDGEKPMTAGAIYVRDGYAWFGLHATLPEARGRGGQSGVIAAGIRDAIAAGVEGLVTETGRPPPGEEAKHPSYRNIRRAGFEDVYLRLNFRRDPQGSGPASPKS